MKDIMIRKMNKEEDLRPIGTIFDIDIPPNICSTRMNNGTVITYKVVDHIVVYPYGEYGPAKWVEEIKTIEIVETQ